MLIGNDIGKCGDDALHTGVKLIDQLLNVDQVMVHTHQKHIK
jgi:hypothetical protein